jgi:hypothetical protein
VAVASGREEVGGVSADGLRAVELYDYNMDPHETTNCAADSTYAAVVARLRTVLRKQYAIEDHSVGKPSWWNTLAER